MFNIKQDVTSLKKIREIIKWIIIVGSSMTALQWLFPILEINIILLNFLFGMSLAGYCILILSSYLLAFCNNIRYLLTYVFITRCLITYYVYNDAEQIPFIIKVIMSTLGFLLIFKTLYNAYSKGTNNKTIA